jgi:hypothetical protein
VRHLLGALVFAIVSMAAYQSTVSVPPGFSAVDSFGGLVGSNFVGILGAIAGVLAVEAYWPVPIGVRLSNGPYRVRMKGNRVLQVLTPLGKYGRPAVMGG